MTHWDDETTFGELCLYWRGYRGEEPCQTCWGCDG